LSDASNGRVARNKRIGGDDIAASLRQKRGKLLQAGEVVRLGLERAQIVLLGSIVLAAPLQEYRVQI
jgi:hypothetical protein